MSTKDRKNETTHLYGNLHPYIHMRGVSMSLLRGCRAGMVMGKGFKAKLNQENG